MSSTSTGASGSRSRRAIHQSISARSAISSSRAAAASWCASSGGSDERAASSRPGQRRDVGEGGALGLRPLALVAGGRDVARALARGGLGLAHEPVGGGVGRVDLRAHLGEGIVLSH